MKRTLELEGGTTYDFDPAADYQGKKFISLHKVSKFKDQVKHQQVTCKLADWPRVKEWLQGCLITNGEGGEDVPPF
jgi:hypothetical protein